MLRPCLAFLLPVFCFFVTGVATAAPEPYLLQRSILDPGTSPQISASQGFSVSVDAGRAVVGAPTDDLGGTDSGVVKVYDTDTGALLHLLLNPSPNASDQFGWSVSISGSRAIVGARFDDTGAANAGIAYIYELAGATPTVPLLTLTNPSPASGDQFGYAVAISGTRIVVGAPFDDTGTNDAGVAYVFKLASATPNLPVATFTNPAPSFTGGFGDALGDPIENYLDTETGEIIPLHEDFDDAAELRERIDASLGERYRSIEPLESHESFRIMEHFAAALPESRLKSRLFDALTRNKPFRHFQDIVHADLALRDQWFAFRDDALSQHARDWLESLGIEAALQRRQK